jgi:hypothetical protein
MRKLIALLGIVAALAGTPALADWTGKDASTATITFKNPNACASVVCTPIAAISDPTGANLAAVPTAGADAQSNTANGLLIYSRNGLWNGTTWDRWTGDLTNGGWVNVKTSVLPTGGATSANQSTEITALNSIVTNTGAAIPAGSAIIGKVGFDQTTNGTTNAVSNLPVAASGAALTDVVCGSAVSSCVLKASAGNLYGVYAECTSACWLMVFNATSLPANGATTAGKASGNLVDCISMTGTAGGSKSIAYTTFPVAMSVGITVAISSTACASLTASTVGFVHGTVM